MSSEECLGFEGKIVAVYLLLKDDDEDDLMNIVYFCGAL